MKKNLLFLIFNLACLTLQAQSLMFDTGFAMGAGGSDWGRSICTDDDGNSYVTGYFTYTVDFDPGPANASLGAPGSGTCDSYLAKYDLAGNYVWAFRIGSTGNDYGYGIDIDAAGNIFISGTFNGTVDFNPGLGINSLTSNGEADIYVAKYTPDGSYVWAINIGGVYNEFQRELAVDTNGDVIITGICGGTIDFDPGAGVSNLVCSTSISDIYVAKYSSSGNYMWAKNVSGATGNGRFSHTVDTDDNGNIYFAGFFNGTLDFDPGPGTATLIGNAGPGAWNAFIACYTSNGNYNWATNIGDSGNSNDEIIYDISVAEDGTSYVAGYFSGVTTSDFDPSAGITAYSSAGGADAFIASYSPTGSLLWVNPIQGTGLDVAHSVQVGDDSDVYLGGTFGATVDADPSADTWQLTSTGPTDAFVARYNTSGALNWAAGIGGNHQDEILAIATHGNGNLWITGHFFGSSADFDPDPLNATNFNSAGTDDIFMLHFSQCANVTIDELTHEDVNCFGANNGSVTIDANSTGLLTYEWVPNVGSGETLSGLAAGTYECTVTNECGSENTISIAITEPAEITTSLVAQNNVSCFGENDGSLEIEATGGTGTLSFEWQPGGLTTETINNLSAGNYTCTVTDQNGCEEDLLVSVTQPAAITFTQNINLCYGEEITVGTNTYSSNGTYQDVLTALNGCDSTVTTNLTIHPEINTAVNQSDITLTAVQNAATYQWIDCNNGNAPLTGETNQSFTAGTNGSYAVVITQGSCSDTSACMLLTDVGVTKNTQTALVLYPNPANDILFINCQVEIIRAELTDMQGKIIQTIFEPAGQICLQEVATGTYYIRLVTENNEVLTRKITKQNL